MVIDRIFDKMEIAFGGEALVVVNVKFDQGSWVKG